MLLYVKVPIVMVYAVIVPLDLGVQEGLEGVFKLIRELLLHEDYQLYFSEEPFTVKTMVGNSYIYITFGVNTLIMPLTDPGLEDYPAKFNVRYFKVYEPFRVKAFQFREKKITAHDELKQILPSELECLISYVSREEAYIIGLDWSSRIVLPLSNELETPSGIFRQPVKLKGRVLKSVIPWHPICYGVKELRLSGEVDSLYAFKVSEENYLCDPLFRLENYGDDSLYGIILYDNGKVVFSDSKMVNVNYSVKNYLLLLLLNSIIYTCSERVNVRIV